MKHSMRSRAPRGGISKLLIASYFFDWIIIVLTAAVGGIFSLKSPNKRPFSLTNPEISFPHVTHEKVSTVVLGIVAVVGPAVIIALVCLLLVPGPTVSKSTPKALIWKRKLWEWHSSWLGLALSLAAAFIITNGMKNLFGKPRPDLLSRCQPDLANVQKYIYDGSFSSGINDFHVVSASICTQTDKSMLNDGFRSFPSGHASFSAAGLIYLSLFLASKLAITMPFLVSGAGPSRLTAFPSRAEKRLLEDTRANTADKSLSTAGEKLDEPSGHDDSMVAARNQAAAPPVYLLVIAVIPFFAAIYIASTRYSDFRHHGFDILFGFFIGTVSAVFAFRYYHLPINQGAGWSWGPRSRDRSLWAGVGVGNYVGSKHPETEEVVKHNDADLEAEGAAQRNATNDVRP